MRELTKDEIAILQRHANWIQSNGKDGERADLCGANLCGADLYGANLCGANLYGANLCGADLRSANLCGANLCGAKLDFSSWPLWCGSKDVKADDRLVAQLFFHATRLDVSQCSGGVKEAMEHVREMAISNLFCEYRNDILKIEG